MNIQPHSNPQPSLKILPVIGPAWFGMLAVLFLAVVIR